MNNDGHDDRHDGGLAVDLAALMSRRHLITLLAGAGALALAGCGSKSENATAGVTSTTGATSSTGKALGAPVATTTVVTGTSTTIAPATTVPTTVGPSVVASSCSVIPAETAGPYPGDGSNGPNVLTVSGIVRRDIRSSLGTSTTMAKGIPLTINLGIFDSNNGCRALTDAAVYLWHCDADGLYSMYSKAIVNENYLRGVQESNNVGVVTFTSIFPGCYDGRWPHIHFEIFPTIAKAAAGSGKLATSQLALPEDACKAVYGSAGYGASLSNLARTSLSRDNVFSDDGGVRQLPTMSGSVAAGYVANLAVVV